MTIIGRILHEFYCLTISDAVLLLLACSFAFCWMDERLSVQRWWRWAIAGLLMLLITAVIYTTIGNRSQDYSQVANLRPFHSYREVMDGGHPEIYRSNFMNAALFYPVGLLAACILPKKWRDWCRCLLVMVLIFTISTGIECLQYRYGLGLCEIDDVIHNTAGALAGSLAAVQIPRVCQWLREYDLL